VRDPPLAGSDSSEAISYDAYTSRYSVLIYSLPGSKYRHWFGGEGVCRFSHLIVSSWNLLGLLLVSPPAIQI
jgi:hypothetical protein